MRKFLSTVFLVLMIATVMNGAENNQAQAEPATTQPAQNAGQTQQPASNAEQEAKVKFSTEGEIEVSATYTNLENTPSESGINALANLGFNASYGGWLTGKIALEIETSEEYSNAADILDEAYLVIGNTKKFPLFATIGKFQIPFQGIVESSFFSDSMTLEFGELKLPAIQISAKIKMFELGIGVFKTSQEIDAKRVSNHIYDGYAYLKFNPSFLEGLVVNVSIVSNVLDGGFLSEGYAEYLATSSPITHRIPALAAGLTIPVWKLTITGEFIAALRKVEWQENSKPYLWFIELAFAPIKILNVGVRFEHAKNADCNYKIGGIIRFIQGNFNVALEYLYMEKNDDNKSKGSQISAVATFGF